MSNKCGRIINNELDEMWEKDVVANSKALSTHLLVQIKEQHPPPPKKKKLEELDLLLRLDPSISQIKI